MYALLRHSHFAAVKSRTAGRAIFLGALLLVGASLRAWVEPVWQQRRADLAPIAPVSTDVSAVHGLSFGVLGGFRAVAADLVWLKAYVAWENRDAAAAEALLGLATALDARVLTFWINGARMMAYDIPVWRIDAAGGSNVVSPFAQRDVIERQSRRALAFLDTGAVHHPGAAALWIERANIELHRLNEPASAAESYRRAAELPDAPYYAARLHGELLRRLGRPAEALAWLTQLHPRLPANVPAAAAGVVLARIRSLEHELSVEAENCYRLQTAGDGDHSLTVVDRGH